MTNVIRSKDITYSPTKGDEVEYESTEQSVLGIRYEVANLFGRTSQNNRYSRIVNLKILSILTSAHADSLVMEPFT